MTVVTVPVPIPTTPVPPLPELGLSVAEELAGLRKAVANLSSIITNFNAGGVTETYLEACAIALGNDASAVTNGALAGVYEALNNVQDAAFILTANGAALDNKAADVGVYRKPAAAANTLAAIAFYPQNPAATVTVIPPGVILSAPNADPTIGPTLYQTTSSATLNVGATVSTLADVVCLSAGSVGNCPPGSINQIVAGASGYTVTNVVPITGGTDTESDDDLRERALNAIPAASQCTVFALEQAALKYPGIKSAVVYDLTSEPPDLIYITLGKAQIFCDDGTGTLGSITLTTDTFMVPNIGLEFTVPVADKLAFNPGSNVVITGPVVGGAQVDTLTALVIKVNANNVYTLQLNGISVGSVGDEIDKNATVMSPTSTALADFNRDLDAGYWKAAGAQVRAWGSTQVGIQIYMEVYISQDYLLIASEAEILAAVQQALFQYVNALAIGRPVVLSALIDTAENVGGIAEVPLQTVLINGTNTDYGVDSGVLTMVPSQTCRIATLSDVTVINRLTVPYS